VVFVPDDWTLPLFEGLQMARRQIGYWGEVHYRDIKSGSIQDKAFLVAAQWLKFYLSYAVRGCPFKAFFVEDSRRRHFPYPAQPGYETHLSRSLVTCLISGLRWSFWKEPQLRVIPVFDETDSELEIRVGEKLSLALQRECNLRRITKSKRYPCLRVANTRFATSNPTGSPSYPMDTEFVQLCDVLLGASFEALRLTRPSGKAGRHRLSRRMLPTLSETAKAPWLQSVSLSRNFSVSLYPDRYNFAYPAVLRRKIEPGDQLRLPGFGRRSQKRAQAAQI
jgi:hypothetical protein